MNGIKVMEAKVRADCKVSELRGMVFNRETAEEARAKIDEAIAALRNLKSETYEVCPDCGYRLDTQETACENCEKSKICTKLLNRLVVPYITNFGGSFSMSGLFEGIIATKEGHELKISFTERLRRG